MRTMTALLAISIFILGVGTAFWLAKRTAKAPAVPPPTAEGGKSAAAETNLETTVGETLTITLDANATTGYQWEPEFDADFLKLAERIYIPEVTPGLVGAGGQETFKFQSLKAGETKITFSYLRSWEKEPIESRVYTVVIK